MEKTYYLLKKNSADVTPTLDLTIPFYLENRGPNQISFSFDHMGDITNFTYSTDNENWSSTKPDIPVGGRVYVKAEGTYCGEYDTNCINASDDYNVGGNIMSLMYGSNFTGQETTFPDPTVDHGFRSFFYWTPVVDASNLILPATTLVVGAYERMFQESYKLEKAPLVLPATTMTKSCYDLMFYNCGKLNEVSFKLPATTLAEECYRMMFAHSSVKIAPDLPATAPATNCYNQMYYQAKVEDGGVISLATLKENGDYDGCITGMFQDCKAIKTIIIKSLDWQGDCNWLWNPGTGGTVVYPAANTDMPRNWSGVPTDWKAVTY